MSNFIYHITSQDAWGQAYLDGVYSDASLETEGFIHCCYAEQLPFVSNNYYRGLHDQVVLKIQSDLIGSLIKDEGKKELKFPHIYGTIPLAAVKKVYPLFWDPKKKKYEKPQGL